MHKGTTVQIPCFHPPGPDFLQWFGSFLPSFVGNKFKVSQSY